MLKAEVINIFYSRLILSTRYYFELQQVIKFMLNIYLYLIRSYIWSMWIFIYFIRAILYLPTVPSLSSIQHCVSSWHYPPLLSQGSTTLKAVAQETQRATCYSKKHSTFWGSLHKNNHFIVDIDHWCFVNKKNHSLNTFKLPKRGSLTTGWLKKLFTGPITKKSAEKLCKKRVWGAPVTVYMARKTHMFAWKRDITR